MFVNDVRIQFKLLNDGARIILGGVLKSYQQGSKFPAACIAGPHIVYEYHVVKDHSVTSLYRDPVFTPDALIKVEEFVGGRFVKEVYHTEDFNMTLVRQHCCIIALSVYVCSDSSTQMTVQAAQRCVCISVDLEIVNPCMVNIHSFWSAVMVMCAKLRY